jgi:hypothetical protein
MGMQAVIRIVGTAVFLPAEVQKIDRFHSSSSRPLLPLDLIGGIACQCLSAASAKADKVWDRSPELPSPGIRFRTNFHNASLGSECRNLVLAKRSNDRLRPIG